jgi:endoglycosylceramidase
MNANLFRDSTPLVTRENRFFDPQGRHVILHGINLVNKDPQQDYIGTSGPSDFTNLRRWGFNCLRLGVIWDGLEPEPGNFNKDYLQKLDQQIAWAKQNSLYVFLDMHQDLYSVLFSDGAPEWATLTDGQPHIDLGGVWSDAYFTSPAVQAALDNFWSNSPAPDGLGLQEHYARAWQVLAQRFAHEPTVIGYDIMNEPFPGSAAAASQMLLFEKGAELLTQLDGGPGQSAEELAMRWLDPTGRAQILQRLEDIDLYASVIDVTQPVYNDFERNQLKSLYQRVAQAIRQVDAQKILFLETSMGSNMGVFSGLEPLQMPGGDFDPQQAYAPHGYDLVVDTVGNADPNQARVDLIFNRHHQTSRRWEWPMLVGEWGAYGRQAGTLSAARAVSGIFEKLLCSDTYWAYESNFAESNFAEKDFADFSCFCGISRPYPERVAGILESYCHDPLAKTFDCSWLEDPAVTAPSLVYLPDWVQPDPQRIFIEPQGSGFSYELASPGGAWLKILPTGKPVRRKLRLESPTALIS